MVRRLLGEELLSEEFENRRNQDRHTIPFLDMAGRRGAEHHQSPIGIPQVTHNSVITAYGRGHTKRNSVCNMFRHGNILVENMPGHTTRKFRIAVPGDTV